MKREGETKKENDPDCDPVPSLVESSDSESGVDEDEDPQK